MGFELGGCIEDCDTFREIEVESAKMTFAVKTPDQLRTERSEMEFAEGSVVVPPAKVHANDTNVYRVWVCNKPLSNLFDAVQKMRLQTHPFFRPPPLVSLITMETAFMY